MQDNLQHYQQQGYKNVECWLMLEYNKHLLSITTTETQFVLLK